MADSERRRLLPNAILASLQAVVTGGALFLLYKFLLQFIGIEAVGLWSLVLAATSVANLGQLGLSGSALRFVSKYLARGEPERAAQAVQTAVLAVGGFMAIIAVLLFPAGAWFLPFFLDGDALAQGLALWPYAVVSLWIGSIAASLQSALDGCHRADLRSIAVMTASLMHLGLAIALVAKFDIMGLAYAQIAQGSIVAGLNWRLLRRQLPGLPALPLRWSSREFLEMWRYGLHFQAATLLSILGLPIVKFLLTHFGSLATVGYFEMAHRLVAKARETIVGGAQVVTPYFSKLAETDRVKGRDAYLSTFRAMALIAPPAILSVGVLAPAASQLWYGSFQPTFVVFTWLLSIGLLANVLSSPAYFANLGSGDVVWNTVTHAITAVSTIVLGITLGRLHGGPGVVVGWAISLLLAAAFTLLEHKRRAGFRFADLLTRRDVLAIAVNLVALGLAVSLRQLLDGRLGVYLVALLQLCVLGASGVFVVRAYGLRLARSRFR